MYAYMPDGHAHHIPGVDLNTMDVPVDGARNRADNTINTYDVTDRDGHHMRVVVVMWRGIVFDSFEYLVR
jgi:hypothetical protein